MKGYKTIAFNALMLVGSVFGITALDPETINTAVMAGGTFWSVGNMILRGVTNSAIFKDR